MLSWPAVCDSDIPQPNHLNMLDISSFLSYDTIETTYKVYECKIEEYHDKRQCKFWHSSGDRRRNPLETPYSPIECPHAAAGDCPDGDSCLCAHNMMERMFHPELYKISMCTRGPNGTLCERGDLCAFAHSPSELRTPPSRAIGTLNLRESKEVVRDRLIQLIKSAGAEGVLSSELPKRYSETYGKKLEIVDHLGNRCRIKNVLIHKNIAMLMYKNVQPKYVYIADGENEWHAHYAPAFALSPSAQSRSNLDETHHTHDSLDATNHSIEITATHWRSKYESLLLKYEDVQKSNKRMYDSYHRMRKELVCVYDMIGEKSKTIEELRHLLSAVQMQSMTLQQQVQQEQMLQFRRHQQMLLHSASPSSSPSQSLFAPGMWSQPAANDFTSGSESEK